MSDRPAVQVREPLVLVSQVQRSGGTLLSQLFDGHPECHAHPGEISIGKPKKWNWPPLDLAAPETWFDTLFEPTTERYVRDGYLKEKPLLGQLEPDVFPFEFDVALQRELFERCVAERAAATERDVLDCYFTSYFNAWLGNENLHTGPKKAVTGFTPRLAVDAGNLERFFAAYPDGTLISLVRDPRAWYLSASKHREYYTDVAESIALWRSSAEATLAAQERYGERVVVLTYEQLVNDTEAAMRAVASRAGIAWSPVLLQPTFNGRAILANSTGRVDRYGILRERADAFRDQLDAETIARIDELAGDLHARAAEAGRAGAGL